MCLNKMGQPLYLSDKCLPIFGSLLSLFPLIFFCGPWKKGHWFLLLLIFAIDFLLIKMNEMARHYCLEPRIHLGMASFNLHLPSLPPSFSSMS